MRRTLGLIIAVWRACAAVSVSESDFYPIIEYYKAQDYRANQLCEGEDSAPVASDAKARAYPSRPSVGLRSISRDLLASYHSVVESNSLKDIQYQASQKRFHTNWEQLMSLSMAQAVMDSRSGSTYFRGFNDIFCINLQGVNPPEFCQAMGNFSQSAQCLTNYEYENPDTVLQSLAQDKDFGWSSVPDKCLQSLPDGSVPEDLPFTSHDVVPATISSSEILTEGKSYYLLYKAIDHLQRFSEYKYLSAVASLQDTGSTSQKKTPKKERGAVGIHQLFTNTEVPENIIPGWATEYVFMLNEPQFRGQSTLRLPYAVLATRGNDILIVLRRPITTYEARLALYNQLSLKYLYNFTGSVHDGASTIYQTLSGVVTYITDGFYSNRANPPTIDSPCRIIVTGSDLPSSGAAVVLSTHLQRALETKLGSADAVNVIAVAFGQPLVGDKEFSSYVAKTVEVRSIVMQGDSLDLFPCSTTFSCDERDLLPRTGLKTGDEYFYTPLPGRVGITFDDLKRHGDHWGKEDSRLQLAAVKDCAYQCYLSKNFCPQDTDSRCAVEDCESWV